MILNSTDFPLPFSPIKPTTLGLSIVKCKSEKIDRFLKVISIFSNAII